MNWQGLQRRLPLPLVGFVLCVGGYLATVRPASGEASVAEGYKAIWAVRPGDVTIPLLAALRLDPGSPERWTDLAEGMYETGRADDARYCEEQAVLRAPGLPHIAMRAAGMYFRLGDAETALRLTGRVVGKARDFDAGIFQMWQRLGGNAERVYRLGVGTNAMAGEAYFQFLAQADDIAATEAAWNLLRAKGMAGKDDARIYAKALVAARDYERAAAVDSGIANGGFEAELKSGEPGWQVESYSGATVSRDTAVKYSGDASLRMEFDGSNRNAFGHVSQSIPLRAGIWRLHAVLRAEAAPGATAAVPGVGLRMLDRESGRVLGETPRLDVFDAWTPVEAQVAVGPVARLVRIEITRPVVPESALPMKGTVWVDDVSLAGGAAK